MEFGDEGGGGIGAFEARKEVGAELGEDGDDKTLVNKNNL